MAQGPNPGRKPVPGERRESSVVSRKSSGSSQALPARDAASAETGALLGTGANDTRAGTEASVLAPNLYAARGAAPAAPAAPADANAGTKRRALHASRISSCLPSSVKAMPTIPNEPA